MGRNQLPVFQKSVNSSVKYIVNRKQQMRDWIMKNLSWAVLSLLMVCPSVSAADKISAEALLKKNLEAVFAVLEKKDLTQETKKKEIVDIVTPMFDFSLMAKLTLGKKYWPGLTEEQRERFTQLFINRLRTSYLGRLTLYTDEKVLFEPPAEIKDKIHILTYLVSKDKKISILYKFYDSQTSWKIYDLEIQGVSIIRSYRAQFDQVLQNGSFEDLLTKMEKSNEE
jgi:phospholipid transport system substrate-binding protein